MGKHKPLRPVGAPPKKSFNFKLLGVLVIAAAASAAGALGIRHWHRASQINEALVEGRSAAQRQDWEQASGHFRRYLAKNPEDAAVLQEYADANLAVRPTKAEHVMRALRAYRRLADLRRSDTDVARKLVALCMDVGEHSEAEHAAQRWYAVDPSPEAGVQLATAQHRQHKLEEASATLAEVVQRHPHAVQAYALLADVLNDADHPEQARAALDGAVDNNPDSGEALVGRAFFRRLIERDAEATVDLEAAEAQQDVSAVVLLKLADEWRQWGRAERARTVLERLQNVNPDDLESSGIDPVTFGLMRFVITARTLKTLGDYPACVQLAEDTLQSVEPWQRSTYLPFAVELLLAGRDPQRAEQAIQEYEHLVREMPANEAAVATNRLGLMRAALALTRQETFDAIDLLEGVLVADSENLEARRALWQAYGRSEQSTRKLSHLETYVSLMPDDTEAAVELARSYRGLDWSKVLHFATVAEQHSASPQASLLRLEATIALAAQSGLGERLQAVSAELATLRDEHPRLGESYILQARVAALEGRVADAMAALRAALDGPAARADISVTLAGMLVREGRADEARSLLEGSTSRFADSTAPRLALARMHVSEQRMAEAVELLQGLRKDMPRDVRCRMRLLEIADVQNDEAQAQAVVDEIKAIEGDNGLLWRLEQARIVIRSQDWEARGAEAEQLLGVCMERRPSWPAPRIELASLFERTARADQAEQVYLRLVEAQPGNVAALSPLLGMLVGEGRYQDANDILQRLPSDAVGLEQFRIQVAWETGDYDTAVTELRKRINATPDDASSRVLLARLMYQEDSRTYDEALALLDEARGLDPQNLSTVAVRAWMLEREGDLAAGDALVGEQVAARADFDAYAMRAAHFDRTARANEAEKDYRKLTTFEDAGGRGFSQLGAFLMRNGRQAEAIDAWRAGLQRAPEDPAMGRMLTRALLFNGDPEAYEDGQHLLEQGLARNPNDPEYIFLKAETLHREGSPEARDDACTLLEHAWRVEPRHVPACHLLARLTWERGDSRAALERVVLARGANPRNPDLQLLQAEFELRMNRAGVARRMVSAVLKSDPQNAGAQRLELRMDMQDLVERGEHDALLRMVRELRDPQPGDQVIMAHLLASSGNSRLLKEARGLCERALAEDDSLVAGHVGMGRIEYHLGAYAESEKSYRRALELDPRDGEALNDLAWLLATELGNPVEAMGLASRGLAYYPDTPQLLHTRGVAYRQLGDFASAKADLERCIKVGRATPSTQADALLELAEVHVRLADFQTAGKRLQRVRQMAGTQVRLSDGQNERLESLEQQVSRTE